MLQSLIVQRTGTVQSCFTSVLVNTGGKATSEVLWILDHLLYKNLNYGIDSPTTIAEVGHSRDDSEVEVMRAMRKIDDFTLPFCQIILRLLFDERELLKDHQGGSSQGSMITSLCHSVDLVADEVKSLWVDVISVLDDCVASQVSMTAD